MVKDILIPLILKFLLHKKISGRVFLGLTFSVTANLFLPGKPSFYLALYIIFLEDEFFIKEFF